MVMINCCWTITKHTDLPLVPRESGWYSHNNETCLYCLCLGMYSKRMSGQWTALNMVREVVTNCLFSFAVVTTLPILPDSPLHVMIFTTQRSSPSSVKRYVVVAGHLEGGKKDHSEHRHFCYGYLSLLRVQLLREVYLADQRNY